MPPRTGGGCRSSGVRVAGNCTGTGRMGRNWRSGLGGLGRSEGGFVEWKKRGFSKGTLHYMKKNAESEKPFTLNKHVRERLDQWICG